MKRSTRSSSAGAAFEPLAVRADLRSPVVADAFFPLDGIVLYQAQRRAGGAPLASLPNDIALTTEVDIPLGVVNAGQPNWYYACSWAQWPPHAQDGTDYWNKRFDAQWADRIDFQGRAPRVDASRGRYKLYHNIIYPRSALWVMWYCLGRAGELLDLLRDVTHIGKKRSIGFGRVVRWTVERAPADWSVWRDGKLMRGVPPDEAPAGAPLLYYGLRPPYWHPDNQMMLAVPNAL